MGELHTFWLKKGSALMRWKLFVLKKTSHARDHETSLPEGTASEPEDHHPTSPGNAHGPQYDFIGGFRETLRPE